MLNALNFVVKGDEIEIGVYGKGDAGKADGHNNFSGDSNIPNRPFLPDKGELFTKTINDLVGKVVKSYRDNNIDISKKELDSVKSKKDLYALLKEKFNGESNAQIRKSVANSNVIETLSDAELLGLL